MPKKKRTAAQAAVALAASIVAATGTTPALAAQSQPQVKAEGLAAVQVSLPEAQVPSRPPMRALDGRTLELKQTGVRKVDCLACLNTNPELMVID